MSAHTPGSLADSDCIRLKMVVTLLTQAWMELEEVVGSLGPRRAESLCSIGSKMSVIADVRRDLDTCLVLEREGRAAIAKAVGK